MVLKPRLQTGPGSTLTGHSRDHQEVPDRQPFEVDWPHDGQPFTRMSNLDLLDGQGQPFINAQRFSWQAQTPIWGCCGALAVAHELEASWIPDGTKG